MTENSSLPVAPTACASASTPGSSMPAAPASSAPATSTQPSTAANSPPSPIENRNSNIPNQPHGSESQSPALASAIENQNSKFKNPQNSSRRRRSLIATLPKTVRDHVNQMLDDGLPYTAVRDKLAELGITLTDDCVARWKKGGYQDYLRELRLRDESRARFELTLDLARDEQGIDVYQASHKIAAGLIADAVAEIGADSLREAVKANPLNLLRMLNSLSRLTTGGLKCERHLVDQADRDLRLQHDESPKPKKALSKASIEEMEDALHLM